MRRPVSGEAAWRWRHEWRRPDVAATHGERRYTEVIQHLGERGALRNLPSCPQFTVAGAIATGTHGSGLYIHNLAADVSMLEFMLPNGTTVCYDRERTPELLEGVRVHLGCLGVVTKLTLDVVPYFEVAAYRYDDVPLETAIESLPDVFKTCDSLSIWTSGFGTGPGAGLAWMTYRHFHPHWDASHAVPQHEPPAFGTPLTAKMQRYLPCRINQRVLIFAHRLSHRSRGPEVLFTHN